MSTTIIDRLVSAGQALSGKVYRALAGTDSDGNAQPILVNQFNHAIIAQSILDGTKDAFGRVRSAEPIALLDIKQVFDDADLNFLTNTENGATSTHQPDLASSQLAVTTTTGSKVFRRTREYVPYHPGHTQVILITGRFNAATSGIRKRIGYFDDDNGLFFEQDVDGTIYIVRRTSTSGSPVDNKVAQPDWNIDTLDGTGSSGFTFDPTKFSVFFFAFAWLGGAGATLGIIVDGSVIFVHNFETSGLEDPFISTPSLPIKWEIENVSSSSSDTLLQTCCAAFSEGGFNPRGIISTAYNSSPRTISTTPVPLLSVRLKSAYTKGLLIPLVASSMITSTQNASLVRIIIRGTLTDASWSDTTTNATEFDVSATAISGGIEVNSFLIINDSSEVAVNINNSLAVAADLSGNNDIISLVVNTISAGNISIVGALIWKELI